MIWPILERLFQDFRQPLDAVKDLACEQDLSSATCSSLSNLSTWMGGTHTQSLYLGLDDLVNQARTLAEEARQLAAERRTPFKSPKSQ